MRSRAALSLATSDAFSNWAIAPRTCRTRTAVGVSSVKKSGAVASRKYKPLPMRPHQQPKKGDYATALRLLRPIAERGRAIGQAFLGMMYADGEGVPQDYAVAMSWYRKAAEQGLEDAQYELGQMYLYGRGVTQEYAAAASWYRKAAEQGNDIAQANLGFMYAQDHGVPQDYVIAHMWFKLGAASGNKNAAKGWDMTARR
jgi:TPR repeat protein